MILRPGPPSLATIDVRVKSLAGIGKKIELDSASLFQAVFERAHVATPSPRDSGCSSPTAMGIPDLWIPYPASEKPRRIKYRIFARVEFDRLSSQPIAHRSTTAHHRPSGPAGGLGRQSSVRGAGMGRRDMVT